MTHKYHYQRFCNSLSCLFLLITVVAALLPTTGCSKKCDYPHVSISDATMSEGNKATSDLIFTVTLSAKALTDIRVHYATADNTATTADSDYTSVHGILIIPARQTSGTLSVPVIGDTKHESDETFLITLSDPYGATLGTATASGTILNDDDIPTISIDNVSKPEGNSGTTNLDFTVSLSAASAYDVTVDYTTANDSALVGSDYTATSSKLTIPAGLTVGTTSVQVNGDTTPETNETFSLILSNPLGATLTTAWATGTIFNDDTWGKLNDTGVTTCGDYAYGGSRIHNNNLDCAKAGATTTTTGTDSAGDPVPSGQDANFGRDANPLNNSSADGHTGFSFTKLDARGQPLTDQSVAYSNTPWTCVQDNVTGLIWEVKTADKGLQDKYWTYSWYNSAPSTNGGFGGTENGGSCQDGINCDTEKYVAAINLAGYCGHNTWQIPTRMELQSLVDNSIVLPGPTIDEGYFPNTLPNWFFSSSLFASSPANAIGVSFASGHDGAGSKANTLSIRLVCRIQ